MDLLQQYDSATDPSGSIESDTESPQSSSQARKRKNEEVKSGCCEAEVAPKASTATVVASPSEFVTTNPQSSSQKPPPKRLKCSHLGSSDTDSNGDCVELLPTPWHPAARNLFDRSHPHTVGNWSGRIYIGLEESIADEAQYFQQHAYKKGRWPSSSASVSQYKSWNDNSSKRFQEYARSEIQKFYEYLLNFKCEIEGTNEDDVDVNDDKGYDMKGETSHKVGTCGKREKLIIVPHLSLTNYNDDDEEETGYDDDDDDDSSAATTASISSEEERRQQNVNNIAADPNSKEKEDVSNNHKGLHISLSQQFYLQGHSIHAFLDDLYRRISSFPPFTVSFLPPSVLSSQSEQSQILVNDEKTRCFLTLPALIQGTKDATSKNGMQKHNVPIITLIRAIDEILVKYGAKPYYNDPKIHVSVASYKATTAASLFGDDYLPLDYSKMNVHEQPCDKVFEEKRPQNPISFMVHSIRCDFGTSKKYIIPLA